MIVVHKIMHYTEFLEKSRDSNFSKLEVKVHSNKTLRNPEILSCKMYLNLYDTEKHVKIERGIRGSLLVATQDKGLSINDKEAAGSYLAYFTTGIMTYVPIKIMRKMIEFEERTKVNLSIPNEIKEFVEEYYSLKTIEL